MFFYGSSPSMRACTPYHITLALSYRHAWPYHTTMLDCTTVLDSSIHPSLTPRPSGVLNTAVSVAQSLGSALGVGLPALEPLDAVRAAEATPRSETDRAVRAYRVGSSILLLVICLRQHLDPTFHRSLPPTPVSHIIQSLCGLHPVL